MTKEKIVERAQPILIENLPFAKEDGSNVVTEAILWQSTLYQAPADCICLEGDSLDRIELIMALGQEFDLEISDEDADTVNSVGELYSYLEKRLEVKEKRVKKRLWDLRF